LSEAFSAGSVVAVAGTPGYRRVANGGLYMLHYGEVEHSATNPTSAKRLSVANDAHFNLVLGHYEKYCDIPALGDELKSDYFYISAKDAIEWGMADGYIVGA
jgi:ATP-dependent protease ClpP protease subunit